VRRVLGRKSPRLQCASLSFDGESRTFTLDGSLLFLSPREHAALTALLTRTGYPVDKSQLFNKVFTYDSEANLDAIEVVLHRLRKKLAGSDVHIVTVRGLGYMLESIAGAAKEI